MNYLRRPSIAVEGMSELHPYFSAEYRNLSGAPRSIASEAEKGSPPGGDMESLVQQHHVQPSHPVLFCIRNTLVAVSQL